MQQLIAGPMNAEFRRGFRTYGPAETRLAFHQFGEVPAYPASHGCVCQLSTVAPWTYNFAYVGMPVKVIAKS